MSPVPPAPESSALSRFPAEVLESFQRYRANGDASAVEAVVIAAVVDYRPAGSVTTQPITDRTRLLEDLGYDSVAVAELVFFLEDLFGMTISNEDILAVSSIGDLRACVVRKLAGKTGAA
ncbi:MAG TPA: phosphopantetheine-binding protein [Opitutaceae bacterium]|jgi:acyl carrier protein